MSDAARGAVLLLSLLLCLPLLRPLLSGDMSASDALMRYGIALLIAWGGGTMLASLVAGYARQHDSDEDSTELTRRRTDGPA